MTIAGIPAKGKGYFKRKEPEASGSGDTTMKDVNIQMGAYVQGKVFT